MNDYVPQLSREALASMSADEINAANDRGELNELLGAPVPRGYSGAGEQLTRDDLKHMTSEQINAALDAGRLGGVLGTEEN